MSSSFTALDVTKPDTSTQTMAQADASILANQIALIAASILGEAPSYLYSQVVGTGISDRPQYEYWKNGVFWFRRTNTWGTTGGNKYNNTGTTLEYSSDSGSTWATVATETRTFDSGGALTATTGGGGFATRLEMLWGKFFTLLDTVTAHAALTGTGAHGLGTMSTQSAAAVAITGGTIKATPQGTSTAADCSIDHSISAREIHSAVAFVTTTMNLDLSTASSFSTTATGTGAQALTVTNPPASGVSYSFVLDLTNGGLRTWTWMTGIKWAGGAAPTLTSSGRDILTFWTRDGGTTWNGALFGKAMA